MNYKNNSEPIYPDGFSEENFIGAGLIVAAGYTIIRTGRVSHYLFKNFRNFYKPAIDIRSLIKIPGHEQHVSLDKITCTPSPELFKQHMTYMDRVAIGSAKEFCFKQPCSDFMAEIIINNVKYDIFCDCSTFDPFVSSPLLINIYDLLKKTGKKPKLTMVSYGCMKYDKENTRFNFEGHCFGTTKQQIQWAWSKTLNHKTALFFLQGIFMGIGISLLYHNTASGKEDEVGNEAL